MGMRLARHALTAALVALSTGALPNPAQAAGITFGENGVKALSMGGAFTGLADDLTAVQFNPAGLVQLNGSHFLVDGQLLNHEVTFQRTDADGATAKSDLVRNTAGPFLLPNLAVGRALELAGRRLTIAAGAYAPPSVGRYAYPEPNYTQEGSTFTESPRKFAPQRYGLISSDTIVLYPHLSAAYAITPKISAGASFQYVYSRFQFRQAVTSQFFTPQRQADEQPGFDSIVEVDLHGDPTFTGVFGVLVQPNDSLAFGASFRPPLPISGSGTIRVEPGPVPTQLGAIVKGDQADLALTFPMELRLGASVKPLGPLTVNADVVYEGWQSFDELVLTPRDVTIQLGEDAPATPLGEVRIPKKFHHTFSFRAGAEWAFGFGLKLRGGLMYEQSAMPREYTNIDFAHFDRVFYTAGASYPVGPIELLLAGAFTPESARYLRESEVRAIHTDPTVQGGIVGNGDYTSGGWALALGVRGSFGEMQ